MTTGENIFIDMKIRRLHPWNVPFREAIEIQRSLGQQLVLETLPEVSFVAGADVSCSKESDTIWAGVVVLTYPFLEVVEERWIRGRSSFPYIPGTQGDNQRRHSHDPQLHQGLQDT